MEFVIFNINCLVYEKWKMPMTTPQREVLELFVLSDQHEQIVNVLSCIIETNKSFENKIFGFIG